MRRMGLAEKGLEVGFFEIGRGEVGLFDVEWCVYGCVLVLSECEGRKLTLGTKS